MPVYGNCDHCGAPIKMPPSHGTLLQSSVPHGKDERGTQPDPDDKRDPPEAGAESSKHRKTNGRHTHRIVAEQILGCSLVKSSTT